MKCLENIWMLIKLRELNGIAINRNLKTVIEGNSLYTEYDYNLAGNLSAIYKGRENARKKKRFKHFLMTHGGMSQE